MHLPKIRTQQNGNGLFDSLLLEVILSFLCSREASNPILVSRSETFKLRCLQYGEMIQIYYSKGHVNSNYVLYFLKPMYYFLKASIVQMAAPRACHKSAHLGHIVELRALSFGWHFYEM